MTSRRQNSIIRLAESLAILKADLEEFVKDETCDHAVNICFCGIYRDLQLAEEALTKAEDDYPIIASVRHVLDNERQGAR